MTGLGHELPTVGSTERMDTMNVYPEGSFAWYAWGEGYAYAERTGGVYDAPLSCEWADMPTLDDVGLAVARHVFGASYTRADYVQDREDGIISDDDMDAIADAFEQGYADYREEN